MKCFMIVVCFSVSKQISGEFNLQFIGDYVTPEEEAKREFCDSKYCLLDGDNLFNSATQNISVQPCDDFKEFALGTFIKYRALNDRNRYNGFLLDVQDAHHERQRKVLSSEIDDKDIKLTRNMKSFYAKCVNSRYVNENAAREIREYLKTFNLNFYPEKPSELNLKSFFEKLPEVALNFLFRLELKRCQHPHDMKTEILCLRSMTLINPELRYEGFKTMLYDMNRVYLNLSFSDAFKSEFKDISQKQYSFYKLQNETISNVTSSLTLLTIEDLQNLTSSLDINWLKIINNLLLTETAEDLLINVEKPEWIQELADLLAATDKKILSEFVVYNFLYKYRASFIVYNHDDWDSAKLGVIKSQQRWTQCLGVFYFYMSYAFDFLYSRHYFDEKIDKSVKEFAQESINFVIKKIEIEANLNETFDESLKEKLLNHLKSIELIAAFPDDPEKVELYYERLNFNDHNYVESSLKIAEFYEKIGREPKKNWRQKLLDLTVVQTMSIKYNWDDNVMYIPSVLVHFPYYHPERPHFFNTATIFTDVVVALKSQIREFLENERNITDFDIIDDYFQIGYEYYSEWEKSGEKDLQLGANRLTNRQLYWVAAARKHFVKLQAIIPTSFYPNRRHENENLHNFFIIKPGFIEAFNCKAERIKSS